MRSTIPLGPLRSTHANPSSWHRALRNKSDGLLKALGARGGMLGLSAYPHHLKDGSACTLQSWYDMAARAVDLVGPNGVGIGTDLCQDQPDSIVKWMRTGHWTKIADFGEGSADAPGFPHALGWFEDNRHLGSIRTGLQAAGLDPATVNGVMGGNWHAFFDKSFEAQATPETDQQRAAG